jgi:hypothetical protein
MAFRTAQKNEHALKATTFLKWMPAKINHMLSRIERSENGKKGCKLTAFLPYYGKTLSNSPIQSIFGGLKVVQPLSSLSTLPGGRFA